LATVSGRRIFIPIHTFLTGFWSTPSVTCCSHQLLTHTLSALDTGITPLFRPTPPPDARHQAAHRSRLEVPTLVSSSRTLHLQQLRIPSIFWRPGTGYTLARLHTQADSSCVFPRLARSVTCFDSLPFFGFYTQLYPHGPSGYPCRFIGSYPPPWYVFPVAGFTLHVAISTA